MKLAILGLILGFSNANNGWDYNIDRCNNMKDPECVEFALKEYNYTVPEIRRMTTVMREITERRIACKLADVCPTAVPDIKKVPEPCANGQAAGTWSCNNIDLLSFTSLSSLGSSSNADGNDIWGWTNDDDPIGGTRRYIFTGQTDGASIVDVTDPTNPDILCFIPSRVSINTVWRDIKIVENSRNDVFAAIVADRSGQGMQWVPLVSAITKCRSSSSRPYRLVEGTDFGWVGSGVYTGGTNTHNIVGSDELDNQDNILIGAGKRVYLVGSNSCSGGLLAVNFNDAGLGNNPLNDPPKYGGCFSSDGYTHDAECWKYEGPDTNYRGREICVGYNENSITIVDFTSFNNPSMISRLTYSTSRYTHQGWRTSDESFLLMNDELDESRGSVSSQVTYVVDIRDLENPSLVTWYSGIQSIDHNLYIKKFCNGADACQDYAFEANYRAGLRILQIDESKFNTGPIQQILTETGYFKTWQGSLATSFNGAWSSYVYFNDPNYPGLIAVQDIEQGLFLLDACNAIPECAQSRLNSTKTVQ